MTEAIDAAARRALAAVARDGAGDPGALDDDTTLEGAGLHGVDLLVFVAGLEAELGIELPADLIDVFETVGDVRHFAAVKAGQRAAGSSADTGPAAP